MKRVCEHCKGQGTIIAGEVCFEPIRTRCWMCSGSGKRPENLTESLVGKMFLLIDSERREILKNVVTEEEKEVLRNLLCSEPNEDINW